MISGQCWFTSQPTNQKHNDFITGIFGKAIHRIFIDIADFKKPLVLNQYYVDNTMNNLPDGMRYWENDEGENHVYNGTPGEGSTKNMLIACRDMGAIPLLTLGHSEERTSWLTRNPVNHTDFLEKFCRYLAFYLKDMGFLQAHLEVFNEPQKCIGMGDYAKICKAMIKGFNINPNYKVHVGSNDITIDFIYKNFIDDELRSMLKGHYYSTHILQHGHHGKLRQFIDEVKLNVSVTEFSPNGNWGMLGTNNDWGNFNELRDCNIDIYCYLFGIRRDFFGDIFDEIRVFTREPRTINNTYYASGDWLPIGFAYNKYIALKDFNKKYYKPLPLESEGVMLEKYYYRLKVTYNRDPNKAGVKFIQSCFGLKVDGNFGLITESAVKAYQISKGFDDDGIVGPETFTALIADFPRLYDEMNYKMQAGIW
jgi:hypothetical protein